jgi:hypothetical protein
MQFGAKQLHAFAHVNYRPLLGLFVATRQSNHCVFISRHEYLVWYNREAKGDGWPAASARWRRYHLARVGGTGRGSLFFN